MTEQPTLRDIEIRIEPYTSAHMVIAVSATLDPNDPLVINEPDHEIAQAQIDVAGILARTALRVAPLIERLQQKHRCGRAKDDACSIRGYGPGLEDNVWGEAPTVCLVVPKANVQSTLAAVQRALQQTVGENFAIVTTQVRGVTWKLKEPVR